MRVLRAIWRWICSLFRRPAPEPVVRHYDPAPMRPIIVGRFSSDFVRTLALKLKACPWPVYRPVLARELKKHQRRIDKERRRIRREQRLSRRINRQQST